MKISIDIDCTPAEARSFFGLPDMGPLQAEMMARLSEHISAMDPSEMMKLWMPGGADAFQRMQEAFMASLAGATTGKDRK
jgi:hypothetical protein